VVPPTEPCALRSTQLLKVSTKDFTWDKGGRYFWLTTYHPCSAETSRKSGALIYPEPLGPPRPFAGDLYFFFLICACELVAYVDGIIHVARKSRDIAPLYKTTYIMSTASARRETYDICVVSQSCHGLLREEISFGNPYVYPGTHPKLIILP